MNKAYGDDDDIACNIMMKYFAASVRQSIGTGLCGNAVSDI